MISWNHHQLRIGRSVTILVIPATSEPSVLWLTSWVLANVTQCSLCHDNRLPLLDTPGHTSTGVEIFLVQRKAAHCERSGYCCSSYQHHPEETGTSCKMCLVSLITVSPVLYFWFNNPITWCKKYSVGNRVERRLLPKHGNVTIIVIILQCLPVKYHPDWAHCLKKHVCIHRITSTHWLSQFAKRSLTN